jgi:hypothetical protein
MMVASVFRLRAAGGAIAVALVAFACGGDAGPSGSTPPTALPQPSPTAPTGGGGGDGGASASCALGPGDLNAECGKTDPKLLDAMLAAMDLLVKQSPHIFDKSSESGVNTGQYRVLDKEAYLTGLVANLVAAGYCAQRDPDDGAYERILVKNENGFSENFDVLAGSAPFMRRGGSYFETCTPANFPVDRGGLPAPGSGCGYPYPAPVAMMTCKVHTFAQDVYTLDSTALVGDKQYCDLVGFIDRDLCPVRPEWSSERVPCEAWRLGNAKDTGRPGPTWTVGGQYCTGPESGCANHPTNQHALLVYKKGSYTVCANSGACCTVHVGD